MDRPALTPDRIRRCTAALAVARGVLGLAALVAPRRAGRLAGLGGDDAPGARAVVALFGVREVVLAVESMRRLRAGYPDSGWLRLNAACDAADAAVLARAVVQRGAPRRIGLWIPTSAGAAAAQVAMARALDEMA